jgi:hypothetical protein
MVIEIGCGIAFGSLALIADGMHMSTHAMAFLIAAIAYSYARKHADDPKFVFGTGKVGDLAAYTSAIILGLIGCIIFYDGVNRLLHPGKVNYKEAIPVAFVGLSVNVSSGLVFMGFGDYLMNWIRGEAHSEQQGQTFHHGHGHGHGHSHGHTVEHYDIDDDDAESDDANTTNRLKGKNYIPLSVDCSHDHGHDHGHGHCHDHAESVDIEVRNVMGNVSLRIFLFAYHQTLSFYSVNDSAQKGGSSCLFSKKIALLCSVWRYHHPRPLVMSKRLCAPA